MFKSMLKYIRNFAIQSAVLSFLYNMVVKFFVPKPAEVEIDNGVKTNLYTVGNNFAFLTKRKIKTDFAPLIFFTITAVAAGILAKKK